jgi:hypothetical protein
MMQATAWKNGGSGYGLHIRTADRDRVFNRAWHQVILDLTGQGQAAVTVSPSFWRQCSELRSTQIGRWLRHNGLAPWPSGRPPTVIIEQVADNRFAVTMPTRG